MNDHAVHSGAPCVVCGGSQIAIFDLDEDTAAEPSANTRAGINHAALSVYSPPELEAAWEKLVFGRLPKVTLETLRQRRERIESVERATSTANPPQLTLYYSPKACSLASHIALEESGLPYKVVSVDIRAGENVEANFLKINPSGAVPALVAGNTVITESQAILTYIADLAPETTLIPRPATRARARAHEWMNWISSSVHVTYRSIFRPQTYAGEDPHAITAVREHAKKKLGRILIEVETRLGDSLYALGSEFSVVDAYLFVFYLWSFDERIQTELPPRTRYGTLAARVWSRPAVRTVVAREHAVRVYALPPELAFASAA